MNKYYQLISFWNIPIFAVLGLIQIANDNIINCYLTINHCVWDCDITTSFILFIISAIVMLIYGLISWIEISKDLIK